MSHPKMIQRFGRTIMLRHVATCYDLSSRTGASLARGLLSGRGQGLRGGATAYDALSQLSSMQESIAHGVSPDGFRQRLSSLADANHGTIHPIAAGPYYDRY